MLQEVENDHVSLVWFLSGIVFFSNVTFLNVAQMAVTDLREFGGWCKSSLGSDEFSQLPLYCLLYYPGMLLSPSDPRSF